MPRLPSALLRLSHRINPLLPLLLRPCRELHDAENELRWLTEYAQSRSRSPKAQRHDLLQLCLRRARGEPLQYIMGNQPFGDLWIQCRPGVLIPRSETESYTNFLGRYMKQVAPFRTKAHLKILDLCTGTGCIALQLHRLLERYNGQTQIRGMDISNEALTLAWHNLAMNVRQGNLRESALSQVEFRYGNVLEDAEFGDGESWDVVVSNPPYISRTSFHRDTTRSTRIFEPRLALVPQQLEAQVSLDGVDLSGDVFYPRIMDIAQKVKAKLVVMEVADEAQAQRVKAAVADTAMGKKWSSAVWHDNLYNTQPGEASELTTEGWNLNPIGSGTARAVALMAR